MKTYQIKNARTGHVFGHYDGETSWHALDAFARDAGYRSYAGACVAKGVHPGEFIAVEVTAKQREA